MKNRKLILILSLVLALTMSLGGTLAYLTDTDADVNTMVLGNVKIAQNEQMRDENGELVEYQDKPALPAVYTSEAWADEKVTISGEEFKFFAPEMKNVNDKIVTVTNMGNTKAFVRTIIAIEAPAGFNDDLVHVNVNDTKGITASGWSYATTEAGVRYVYNIFTYTDALAAKATSLPSLMQVFLDKDTTNEDVAKLGEEWEIIALSQAVQADGFADAKTALEEAFPFGESKDAAVAAWLADAENHIGTPGDKNDTNNPPVIAEITVDSVDALIKAVKDGYTVIGLANGEYDIQGLGGVKGITLTGSKDAVIKIMNEGENGCDYGFDGATVTFNGVTFDTSANNGNYKGFARMEATFNNCNFVGSYTTFDNTQFNNCSFNLKNNYVWTWGASKVDFNNCVFEDENGVAKAILVHGGTSATVTVNNCTFKATEPAKTWDGIDVAAVSIDPTNAATIYTINFIGENTVSDAFNGLVQVKYENEASQVTINQ